MSVSAQAAKDALEAAAGRPVLLAIEYGPSMQGVLGPVASVAASALAAQGSQIVTISQSRRSSHRSANSV